MKRPLLIAALAALGLLMLAGTSSGAVSAPSSIASTHNSRSSSIGGNVLVPKLVGKKLPLAEFLIRQASLKIGREYGGTFGPIIKSGWHVCIQIPRAGKLVRRGTAVITYSERIGESC